MPTIEIAGVGDFQIIGRRSNGRLAITVEGDLIDAEGRRWRHVGPIDCTDILTEDDMVNWGSWGARAMARLMAQFAAEQEAPPPVAPMVQEEVEGPPPFEGEPSLPVGEPWTPPPPPGPTSPREVRARAPGATRSLSKPMSDGGIEDADALTAEIMAHNKALALAAGPSVEELEALAEKRKAADAALPPFAPERVESNRKEDDDGRAAEGPEPERGSRNRRRSGRGPRR